MRPRLFPCVCVIALLGPAAAGAAPAARPETTKPQAIALVGAVLKKHARHCEYRVLRISVTRIARGWRVATLLKFTSDGHTSAAFWNVVGGKVVPADPLSGEINVDCP